VRRAGYDKKIAADAIGPRPRLEIERLLEWNGLVGVAVQDQQWRQALLDVSDRGRLTQNRERLRREPVLRGREDSEARG